MRAPVLRNAIAGALLLTIVGGAWPAMAASSESAWRTACTRDALIHCPLQALAGDRPGVRDCLVEQLATLSGACRAVVKVALAEGAPVGETSRPHGTHP